VTKAERERAVKEEKRKAIVKRAEVAIGELKLSAWTQADRTRLDRVLRGLRALDDEQAGVKALLDQLRDCCAPKAACCDECGKDPE
jgi:hypothetical protein